MQGTGIPAKHQLDKELQSNFLDFRTFQHVRTSANVFLSHKCAEHRQLHTATGKSCWFLDGYCLNRNAGQVGALSQVTGRVQLWCTLNVRR